MLAFFGVLLMLVFTIGGMNTSGSRQSAQSANRVVVSWNGGELQEADLQNLRFTRIQAIRFLNALGQLAQSKGHQPGPFPFVGTDSEESIVQAVLLSQQADQLGIVVDDEGINDALFRLTGNTVSTEEFSQLLHDSTGDRLTQDRLYDTLRVELAAYRVLEMAHSGMFIPFGHSRLSLAIPATPASAWEIFNRVHRRVRLEMMPIRVETLLKDVAEPTDVQIAEHYEAGKSRIPIPSLPEPGFRRPRRLAFEYVEADQTAILDEEMKRVTDQEVSDYYQTHREDYRISAAGLLDSPPAETPPAPSGAGDANPGNPQPESGASGGKDGVPSESASPDSGKGDSPEEGANSATEGPSADDRATTDTPADPPAPEVSTSSAEPQIPGEHEPAVTELLSEEATATEPAAATDPPATGESASTPAEGSGLEELVDAPLQPEYRPLEEVAENIRNLIASPRAMDRVRASLDAVSDEMEKYRDARRSWEINTDDEGTPSGPAPDRPNLEKLAQARGLKWGKIPPVSPIESQEHEICREVNIRETEQGPVRVSFLQLAYASNRGLFRPERLGDKYVFWTVEEQPEQTPELADCRDEVIRSWKLRQALDKAKQQAEQEAQRAREENKSLHELFVPQGREVFEPGEAAGISWMTPSAVPLSAGGSLPQFTPIPQERFPGTEFYYKAFSLEPGQTIAIANQPQTVVYVVRMGDVVGPTDSLREQFLRSGVDLSTLSQARFDYEFFVNNWYKELTQQLALEWKRPPFIDRDSMN